MIARRFTMVGFAVLLVATFNFIHEASAQSAPGSVGLVRSTSDKLVAIANNPGTPAEKRRQLQEVVDLNVDVDDIARYCLGRFWGTATPDQRKEYVTLFRDLLLSKIAGHFGEYQGVRVTVGSGRRDVDHDVVNTTVARPRTAPMQVDWVVSTASGAPKIVDLLAGGTSMRLTHSNDFRAYLAAHRYNVHDLVEGMRQLVAQRQ